MPAFAGRTLSITDLESLSALAISWKSSIHSDVIGFFPEPLLEHVSNPQIASTTSPNHRP
jgi:hypothetical protein